MSNNSAAKTKKKESLFRRSDIATVAIILIGFVALMVVIELIQGQFKFFTVANWMNILMQNAVVGIMAMGMTVVMISGGIDLAVGYLASLAGIFIAKCIVHWGWSVWPAIIVGVLLCIALEAGLGAIISYLDVEPFIITLGGSICFRGVALLMSQSREITMPGHELEFVKTNIFETTTEAGTKIQLPIYIIIFVVIAIIVWLILKYTKYGRRVYAVGANSNAAFLAGVNVRRLKLSTYIVNGLLVGIASIVLLGRVGTAIITNGQGLEIDVIACVVIGGVAMSGGKGNGMGTFLGILLLGAITNAMNVLKLQSEWQYVVKGAIIIAAVAIGALAAKIAARSELARQRQEAMAEQKSAE